MKDAYENDTIASFRTGSAFPNLDVKGMLNIFQVVIPDERIAFAFSEIVTPFNDPHIIAENVKLAEMRDYLLPRLLNGSVRVEVGHG